MSRSLVLVESLPAEQGVMLADSTVTLPSLPEGAQVRFQLWADSTTPIVMVRQSDLHQWVPAGMTAEVAVENYLLADSGHSDDPWSA